MVSSRQTQWEPPVADRSPPTPELGYLGDELDSSMDPSLFSSHVPQDVTMVSESKFSNKYIFQQILFLKFCC
jgi:hypothetical protein